MGTLGVSVKHTVKVAMFQTLVKEKVLRNVDELRRKAVKHSRPGRDRPGSTFRTSSRVERLDSVQSPVGNMPSCLRRERQAILLIKISDLNDPILISSGHSSLGRKCTQVIACAPMHYPNQKDFHEGIQALQSEDDVMYDSINQVLQAE